MAKVFILTDQDFQNLFALIDRNPEHGYSGGSSRVLSNEEEKAFHSAHTFYNYQVRNWADTVRGS